jgi:death-on-curing protein
MVYLTVEQILDLHALVLARSGGSGGVRDRNGLESAVAAPRMTFGGADLYPSVGEKAAALGYSLVMNHPFIDGNKRVGHAAMEVMLVLNGYELSASVDEQEAVVLAVAAGEMRREGFAAWVQDHLAPTTAPN